MSSATTNPGITGLGQISINVSDLGRAPPFYRNVLELPLLFKSPPPPTPERPVPPPVAHFFGSVWQRKRADASPPLHAFPLRRPARACICLTTNKKGGRCKPPSSN